VNTSVATAAPAVRRLSTTLRRLLILAPPLVVAGSDHRLVVGDADADTHR
jgi:hypothetical protein